MQEKLLFLILINVLLNCITTGYTQWWYIFQFRNIKYYANYLFRLLSRLFDLEVWRKQILFQVDNRISFLVDCQLLRMKTKVNGLIWIGEITWILMIFEFSINIWIISLLIPVLFESIIFI